MFSLLSFSELLSYSYYNNYYTTFGDYTFGVNARQLAMGGVMGLNENGALNLSYNPSALALSKNMIFTFSGELVSVSENIDTYISTSEDDADLQNNSFALWDWGNAGLSIAFPLGKGVESFHIGVAYTKYLDLNYNNDYIVYTLDSTIDDYIRYAGKRDQWQGQVHKMPLGAAVNIMDFLLLGVSYNIFSGEADQLSMVDIYSASNDSTYTRSSEIKAGNINLGATIKIFKNLAIGGYFETAPEMKIKDSLTLSYEGTNLEYTGIIERKITYPDIIGINFLFRANDYYDSRFLLDITLKNYKNMKYRVDKYSGDIFSISGGLDVLQSYTNTYSYQKDTSLSDTSAEVHNVVEISVGGEHLFSIDKKSKFPVRYGFLYRPSSVENDIKLIAISLGAGLHVSLPSRVMVEVDFGYMAGIRETIDYQDGKYPSMFTGDTSYLRKIKETFNIFMLSLRVKY